MELLLSGLSPGYETRQTAESTFSQSRGTWALAVVRLSRPRSTILEFAYHRGLQGEEGEQAGRDGYFGGRDSQAGGQVFEGAVQQHESEQFLGTIAIAPSE